MQMRMLQTRDREMTAEGTHLACETASRSRLLDTRREDLERIAAEAHPQNIRMLQVGESADAHSLEAECGSVGGELLDLGLELKNFFAANRRSKEF
jgi:hypothetical protein